MVKSKYNGRMVEWWWLALVTCTRAPDISRNSSTHHRTCPLSPPPLPPPSPLLTPRLTLSPLTSLTALSPADQAKPSHGWIIILNQINKNQQTLFSFEDKLPEWKFFSIIKKPSSWLEYSPVSWGFDGATGSLLCWVADDYFQSELKIEPL